MPVPHVREARLAARLTQAELGDRIGVSQSKIARVEAGGEVDATTYERLLEVLPRLTRFRAEVRGEYPLVPATLREKRRAG